MTRAAVFVIAILTAGCVSGTVAPGAPTDAEVAPAPILSDGGDIELRIECDRARVVIPECRRAERELRGGATIGFRDSMMQFSIGKITIQSREGDLRAECAGKDLSIVAEGGVRLFRPDGKLTVEEGPYRTVIFRNGEILRR